MNLSAYSPPQAPILWTWINLFFLVWSILLFIELLFTFAPLDRLEGTRCYLTWNFASTAVWVAEVGLTIHHLKGPDTDTDTDTDMGMSSGWWSAVRQILSLETSEDYFRLLELLVAIYFTGDSFKVFWRWSKADSDAEGELLDAIVSVAAYFYGMVQVCRFRVVRAPDNYSDIDDIQYNTVEAISSVQAQV